MRYVYAVIQIISIMKRTTGSYLRDSELQRYSRTTVNGTRRSTGPWLGAYVLCYRSELWSGNSSDHSTIDG